MWSRDGRELFYVDPSNTLTVVSVDTSGDRFSFGNAVKLFELGKEGVVRNYDVAADGRLLVVKPSVSGDQRPTGMVVVVNLSEELKIKVPSAVLGLLEGGRGRKGR